MKKKKQNLDYYSHFNLSSFKDITKENPRENCIFNFPELQSRVERMKKINFFYFYTYSL